MKNDIRRFISAFVLTSVFIACLAMTMTGKVTIEESAARILYDSRSQMIRLTKNGDSYSLELDRQEIISDLAFRQAVGKLQDYINLSPLGVPEYLYRSIRDILH